LGYYNKRTADRLCKRARAETMKSYQFTILIERDPESGWLVGSVTELPGCYTQAPGLAELETNVREAIQVYLATVGEKEVPEAYPTFVGLQRLDVTSRSSATSA